MKRFVRALVTAPLRFYRRFLSPLKPPSCRFSPTCSQYAIEAIEVHGIVRGTLLTSWRILRCQPFSKGGWDPVPARRTNDACRHDARIPPSGAREGDLAHDSTPHEPR